MALKITHWNIEHANRLIGNNLSDNNNKRKGLVRQTIERINPDILCMVEGPKGEQTITDFCQEVLDNRWVPKLLQN